LRQYIIAPLFVLFIGLFGREVLASDSTSVTTNTSPATIAPIPTNPPPPSTVVITPPPTTTTLVLTEEQIAGLRQLQVEKDRETWGKCGEWHDLAIQVGWPEAQWKYLQQVIHRESRCQVDAWNGSDAGLLQVNRTHRSYIGELGMGEFPDAMFNAENNLWFGLLLWEGSGKNCWKHWRFSGTTFGCEK
jgi:hypothetical protein